MCERARSSDRPVRHGSGLAPTQRPGRHARPDEPVHQRRVRPARPGVRHPTHLDDAAESSVLCRPAQPLRLPQGQGSAGVREHDHPPPRAHRAGGQRNRAAQGHHAARTQHAALQRGGRAGQGPLQRSVGEELGVRAVDRSGDRPPRQTAQAYRRARPRVLCRARRTGHRLRRGPARLERRAQAQPVGAFVSGHPQGSVVRPQGPPPPHPAAGRAAGLPLERRRRVAVPLDLDQRTGARIHLGRRRLDARGQRGYEQRDRAARLPALPHVPDLRQVAVKAFVTGGTGFVGAHLVRALLERGDEVRCLVRNPAKAGALGWSSAVELVRGDLDDARALREGCAGAEVVYHVAGRVSAPSPAAFMAANRDGTARVLEAAAVERPRRLLYVSSLAAAGPTLPGQPIDESRPPAPVTPYGRSKLAAELLVRATPVPWTIVRPPTVYGERDRELFKLFKLARAAVVPVFGDGSQELSVIYAADLADALIAAATAQGSVGAVYYAAHPSVTTSRELVRAIARAVGGRGDRVGRRGREPRI